MSCWVFLQYPIAVSEDADTIEEAYEPFLIQEGYIMRTQEAEKLPKGILARR